MVVLLLPLLMMMTMIMIMVAVMLLVLGQKLLMLFPLSAASAANRAQSAAPAIIVTCVIESGFVGDQPKGPEKYENTCCC